MIRVALLLLALPAHAAPPVATPQAGAAALAHAASAAGDWDSAARAAAAADPAVAADVQAQALAAGWGDLPGLAAFLAAHPAWPTRAALIARGDALLTPDMDPAAIRAWLGARRPDTLPAALALLGALPPAEAAAEARRFWTAAALTPAEEDAFLAAHAGAVADAHSARAQARLDAQDAAAAARLLGRVPEADRALIAARIAIQSGRDPGAVPPARQGDPGLQLDQFRAHVAARRTDAARALMLARSGSAAALRDPAAWAPLRADHARAALRAGDWALAERLAGAHRLPDGDRDRADLEWLAGYAALRAGAPDRAAARFAAVRTAATTAITLARADYWTGRAAEAAGDAGAARAAYAAAAAQPATFYGQLAAERIRLPMPAALVPGAAPLPDWRTLADAPARAALWRLATGDADGAQALLLPWARDGAVPPEAVAAAAGLMLDARRPWHALRLSKAAAGRGIVFPAAHFPLPDLGPLPAGVPPELVLAIARQESEFNPVVRSRVGARGLMQLMPATAEETARRLRLPWREAALTADPGYNITLGTAYLAGLRDRFGPSVALVASGYNAGPGRPARWLGQFGDLRRGADPVDWVEMIPFDETRNYVMRVAEALPVYRAALAGRPVPLVPTWDLTGGGLMPSPPPRLTLALSSRPPPRPFIGPPWPGPP